MEANRLASKTISVAVTRRVQTFRSAITGLGIPYGWPTAAGMGGKADIFGLMDEIMVAQEEDYDQLPRLALNAIAIAAEITAALFRLNEHGGLDGILGGATDRLPLELAAKRLDALADAPMQALWDEIIESWVLGQHVRWSVMRSGDDTQRLRVAVDEGGWVRLRTKISGPFRPTPDRLATALALSANCGLLRRTKDDEPLYTLA